ncbi:MAG: porin [SAR86 cluster bacterium]|jgi:predicted porin|nr:porin [SAR86 cluster bacterium]
MVIKGFALLVLICLGMSLSSEPKVYGKLWITVESQNKESGSKIDMVSNASRLGMKGNMGIGEDIEAIYQAEYEVDPVDGTADEKKQRTFKQRNSFVGIKGSYGTFFIGTHDTAFKESGAKIDLFNDLAAGDIRNILQGENRMSDFIGYRTPLFGDIISATFNAIKGEKGLGDNSIFGSRSISVNYKTKSFYAALSVDSEIKGYDSIRLSLKMPFNRTQIGFIYQDTEKINTGEKEDGYVVSLSQKIGNKGIFKLQIAESDMKLQSGKQASIGYDYKLSAKFKVLFFFTDLSLDTRLKQQEVGAVGFEYKF